MSGATRVCLLGFGEVGQLLATQLRGRVAEVSAWDLLFDDANSAPRRAAAALRLPPAPGIAEAVSGADLVISAVTAAQCVSAAQAAAKHVGRGAWYLDLNSVSPATRAEAAQSLRAAGARYVEAAVMAPIHPAGLSSPMLTGGGDAADFQPLAQRLGFSGVRVFSAELGAASAAKMCRSVVIKGLEALVLESLLTARHFSVETVVLESLREGLSRGGDDGFAGYLLSRALSHGRRRAEEMREVARTVREAGVQPRMSEGCAGWQDWASGKSPGAADRPIVQVLDELTASVRREVAP